MICFCVEIMCSGSIRNLVALFFTRCISAHQPRPGCCAMYLVGLWSSFRQRRSRMWAATTTFQLAMTTGARTLPFSASLSLVLPSPIDAPESCSINILQGDLGQNESRRDAPRSRPAGSDRCPSLPCFSVLSGKKRHSRAAILGFMDPACCFTPFLCRFLPGSPHPP